MTTHIVTAARELVPRRSSRSAKDEKLIGQRLGAMRRARGLTQVELAKQLGMSQPLLSKYERGELRLHGALVARIATALKGRSDVILGLSQDQSDGFFKDRRFLRQLQKIDRLSRREKDVLLATIDRFLKGAGIS